MLILALARTLTPALIWVLTPTPTPALTLTSLSLSLSLTHPAPPKAGFLCCAFCTLPIGVVCWRRMARERERTIEVSGRQEVGGRR